MLLIAGLATSRMVLVAALVLIIVFGAGLIGTRMLSITTTTESLSYSSSSSTHQTTGTLATVGDLIAGKFRSASDKHGTNGVLVTVLNLRVLYVMNESDGDWHVGVTDGRIQAFITEITPAYQASEGRPPVGLIIDGTGFAYCDRVHQTESWHGNTCWEIHPIISWMPSAGSTQQMTSSLQNTTNPADLNISISFGQNPIIRGSEQSILVIVSDSDGPIANASVSIKVVYASGVGVHNFSCATGADGSCQISWVIGSTSDPGTFRVTVNVYGENFFSSFLVTS